MSPARMLTAEQRRAFVLVSVPTLEGGREYHGVRDATCLRLASQIFAVPSTALRDLRRGYLDDRDGADLVVVHLYPGRVVAERLAA